MHPAEHIYMWREGHQGESPTWRRHGQSLEYEMNFDDGIRWLRRRRKRTTEFSSTMSSETRQIPISTPTDPRLTSISHDVRL